GARAGSHRHPAPRGRHAAAAWGGRLRHRDDHAGGEPGGAHLSRFGPCDCFGRFGGLCARAAVRPAGTRAAGFRAGTRPGAGAPQECTMTHRAMNVSFEKPSIWQRVKPIFQGFDLPLLGVVLFLCAFGLITMYSAGYDNGSRFGHQLRNVMLAGGLMFLVAQVPPQRLMTLAVPLFVLGVLL